MNKRRLKAQSAMEYLMTYGWAILIISVVLGALFSIGVFSGGALLGTSCIAASGFYCSGLSLSHTTGQITVTVGQNTGTNWPAYGIAYVPQGWSVDTSGIPKVPAVGQQVGTSLPSGGQLTYTNLAVVPPGGSSVWGASNALVGTTTAGSIWMCYGAASATGATFGAVCTGSPSGWMQIATLTVKST